MTTYAKALKKMADNPKADRFEHMTATQIEAALAEIAEQMRGPMPDVERAMLFGDRVDLRAALAKKQAAA